MKNILIVEDDTILAFVHQKCMEQIGYNVVGCVESGVDAIEAVKTLEPDMILMDILLLGDLDGVQTMDEIRKFSDVPVIYVTGNSNPFIKERALATTGRVAFLTKPVSLEMFTTVLYQVRLGITQKH
ncbi:MAG: response regulator [Bacteroidota bacterium]